MTFQERRSFTRIPFWFVARYRHIKDRKADGQAKKKAGGGDFRDARGKNLSASGILIETEEHFPVSSILEIELDIPSVEEPIILRGRVARSHMIEDGMLYDTGIAFEDDENKHMETVNKFIELFK